MAMLEATKVYGDHKLKEPGAQNLTQAAQNEWAQGVRQEVQNGTADPRYLAMVRPQSGGQPALINQPDAGGASGP
jgi:hypothetical protein